jgi:hypothetical protein
VVAPALIPKRSGRADQDEPAGRGAIASRRRTDEGVVAGRGSRGSARSPWKKRLRSRGVEV